MGCDWFAQSLLVTKLVRLLMLFSFVLLVSSVLSGSLFWGFVLSVIFLGLAFWRVFWRVFWSVSVLLLLLFSGGFVLLLFVFVVLLVLLVIVMMLLFVFVFVLFNLLE